MIRNRKVPVSGTLGVERAPVNGCCERDR